MTKYVHGYSTREAERLKDQAQTLDEIIHNDSVFPENSIVLEAGCGVGAQTKIIASKNPNSQFISIDISEDSLLEARSLIDELAIPNVRFIQSDIFNLPFSDEYFDVIVLCFVLEHLHDPALALNELKRVQKKGGTLMVIEGDHGSTFFYPNNKHAQEVINCQIELQKRNGGNSNIGRELYPLLKSANLNNVEVCPRMVYVDHSKPKLVEGFIKNTFTAMIEGVKETSIKNGLMNSNDFQKGIDGLYRTAEPDGVFSYTFF